MAFIPPNLRTIGADIDQAITDADAPRRQLEQDHQNAERLQRDKLRQILRAGPIVASEARRQGVTTDTTIIRRSTVGRRGLFGIGRTIAASESVLDRGWRLMVYSHNGFGASETGPYFPNGPVNLIGIVLKESGGLALFKSGVGIDPAGELRVAVNDPGMTDNSDGMNAQAVFDLNPRTQPLPIAANSLIVKAQEWGLDPNTSTGIDVVEAALGIFVHDHGL